LKPGTTMRRALQLSMAYLPVEMHPNSSLLITPPLTKQ
jgi:hypothetical protein